MLRRYSPAVKKKNHSFQRWAIWRSYTRVWLEVFLLVQSEVKPVKVVLKALFFYCWLQFCSLHKQRNLSPWKHKCTPTSTQMTIDRPHIWGWQFSAPHPPHNLRSHSNDDAVISTAFSTTFEVTPFYSQPRTEKELEVWGCDGRSAPG